MKYEDLPRGRARIVSYVPTIPALRYLNCCTMTGWHCCNELYSQTYKHGVTMLLLIYTVDGFGKLEMNGKTYTLCKNSVIFVPPNTPMRYATDVQHGAWEFYWLDLVGERILSLADKICGDGYCFLRNVTSLEGIFSELLKENGSELECSALIGKIFDTAISKAIFNAGQEEATVDRILHYIAQHYTERLDLPGLSTRFYLSQNQLIRVVRDRTGYTPHEYLIRLRLAKACEMLQCTDLSVREIGNAVGYDNSSHFCAAFRRLFGITPAKYRTQLAR